MRILTCILIVFILTGCSSHSVYKTNNTTNRKIHKKYSLEEDESIPKIEAKGRILYLICSYYADDFHGKQTSNGEIFDMYKYTCAHKTLPFNTRLKVTNEDTGESVLVRVNDRGPFVPGRDLDLSYAAAKKIGLVAAGVKEMKVEVLEE